MTQQREPLWLPQGCVYPKEREGRDHKRVREPLLVTRPAPAQAFLGLEAGRRSM